MNSSNESKIARGPLYDARCKGWGNWRASIDYSTMVRDIVTVCVLRIDMNKCKHRKDWDKCLSSQQPNKEALQEEGNYCEMFEPKLTR